MRLSWLHVVLVLPLFLIILYLLVFKISHEPLECVEFRYFLVRKRLRRNAGLPIAEDDLDNKSITVRSSGDIVSAPLSDRDVCTAGVRIHTGRKGTSLTASILALTHLGLSLRLCHHFFCQM